MADGFWDNADAAHRQMKKIKDLQKWVNDYSELEGAVDEVKLALDFFKEEIVTEEEVDAAYAKAVKLLEDLELRNMLRREEDIMSAVLKSTPAPRHRKPGLGFDAHAYVYALGRRPQIQAIGSQPS